MSPSKNERMKQAAAVPVRLNGRGEICLITTGKSKRWGIPKGLVDPGDTLEETALKEAWEEAGVRGRLIGDAIGTYEYEKWDAVLEVVVYVMEVLEEKDRWPERDVRDRQWVSFGKAVELLADHPAFALVERALQKAARAGR